MTRRPAIVLIGTAVQTGFAGVLAGSAALFASLIYSLRNSATTNQGLKLALLMALPLSIVACVASWGMWKGRAWGWWTALIFNVLAVATMAVDLINGAPDLSDFVLAAVFVLSLALLLPAPVRSFFFHRDERTQVRS